MRLVSAPDFRHVSRHIGEQLSRNYVTLAKAIILDNTDRIRERLAFDGAAQKKKKEEKR